MGSSNPPEYELPTVLSRWENARYAEEIARVRLDLSRLETQLDVGI